MPNAYDLNTLLPLFSGTKQRVITYTPEAKMAAAIHDLIGNLGIDQTITDDSFKPVVTAIQGLKPDLTLNSLTVGLDPTLNTVDFAAFEVGLDGSLSVALPGVESQSLALTCSALQVIAYPYDADPNLSRDLWSATLVATATLLGVTVELSLTLPGLVASLVCNTPTGKPATDFANGLGHNAEMATLSSTGGTPATIAYLEALVDFGRNLYAIQVGLDTGLSWNGITLQQVAFSFTYAGEADFSLAAQIALGDPPSATVQVALTKDGAALTLAGAAFFDPPLDVKDFVSAFSAALKGALTVKTWDDCPFDLTITSLAMQVANDKTLWASCAAALVLEATGTTVQLALQFDNSGDFTLQLAELELQGSGSVYVAQDPANPLPLSTLIHLLQLEVLADIPFTATIGVKSLFLASLGKGTPHLLGMNLVPIGNASVTDPILTLITGGDTIALQSVTLLAASAAWTAEQLQTVNPQLQALNVSLNSLAKGLNFVAALQIGTGPSVSAPLIPSAQDAGDSSAESTPPAPAPVTSPTAARWFEVQKQLGPVHVQRVGFALGHTAAGDPQVALLCDASFTLGPMVFALEGFSFTFPLTADFTADKISVALQGLSLTYTNPPLLISGGFLDQDGFYAGEALLQTETLSLAALGEYKDLGGGHISLALFAALTNPPLGGPVFCYVTGLAAGFGYNNQLQNLPATPAEVAGFILLQMLAGDAKADLDTLRGQMTPVSGENWLAVGLRFRSFELLQSSALLTVTFGHELQFALLGQSEISIPPQSPQPILYAQVDIVATYRPNAGELQVLGALSSNSYVLAPDCHLSGGFAYLLKASGDFVATFGGYAKDFDYAAQGYPPVPRLQIAWQVDDHTSIQGDAYFALTPAVMMAGGALQATWNCGIFSAWFTTEIAFFVQWRPFHYTASCYMALGVSFDLSVDLLFTTVSVHFSFQVGASLQVDGPPFHGYAHIDLDVVSFTIEFGGSPQTETLGWADFRAILPVSVAADANDSHKVAAEDAAQSALLAVKVTDGLIKDLSQPPDHQDLDWVVNGTHFCFEIQSSLPVTETTSAVNGTAIPFSDATKNTKIGILPMGISSATGQLMVTLTGVDADQKPLSIDMTSMAVTPLTAAFAPAHWGLAKPGLNDTAFKATSGCCLGGGHPDPDRTVPIAVDILLSEKTTLLTIVDSTRPVDPNPFA